MLVIESGEGLPNSESYIDLTYLQDYANKRGIDSSGMTESNIIKAMDYFETSYTFKGTKLKDTQALEFPRLINGVVEYPVRVKSAVCELALKSTKPLLKDTERATIEKTIGEITVKYDKDSPQETNYNYVYNLVMPYLENGSSFSSSIVRTYWWLGI